MRFFRAFFLIIEAMKKNASPDFGRVQYFAFDRVQKICQTGYKRGECTKTTVQILLLLLKEISEKQYF